MVQFCPTWITYYFLPKQTVFVLYLSYFLLFNPLHMKSCKSEILLYLTNHRDRADHFKVVGLKDLANTNKG